LNSQEYHQKINQLQSRIGILYKEVQQILEFTQDRFPDLYNLMEATLEELETTLEELSIAEDELRRQAEEISQSRRLLEAERQRYQELFEFAPYGYLVTDPSGKIMEANRVVAGLLNLPQAFLIGKLLSVYIVQKDKNKFQDRLNQLAQWAMDQINKSVTDFSSQPQLTDWEIWITPRKADPFLASLTVRANHILDDEIHFRWMMRDITQSKQMQAELDEMRGRLIESVEEERLRLARELHDGPVQDLYALTYQVTSLQNSIEDDQPIVELDHIREALQGVINSLRTQSVSLRPPTLKPFGLDKTIESHAGHFQKTYPELEVSLQLDTDGLDLSEREQLALYRIYQQAMINVVRHAEASHVRVNLIHNDRAIQLSIQDDGKGFEVPRNWIQMVRQGHLGLGGSSERAAAIGGKMKVNSEPGRGTTVEVVVPKSLLE
jgi:signal transduction histidine kinase